MTTQPNEYDTQVIGGGATPPRTPLLTFDSANEFKVATTVGVGLLSAATAVSAIFSRMSSDLDGKVFAVGAVTSLGMLFFGLAASLLIPRAEEHTLVSWPGSAGVVGTSLMLAILLDNGKSTTYVCSVLLLVLSGLGFAFSRSGPFLLSGILGFGIFYLQAFSDLFDLGSGDSSDNTIMLVGGAVLVFVLLVTVLGWLVPQHRILVGISVGAAGTLGILGSLYVGLTLGAFYSVTSSSSFGSSDDDFSDMSDFRDFVMHNPFTNDIYVVLGYVVVLIALWSACAMATGHVGFRVLTVTILTLSVPMATVALMTKHPGVWSIILALLGALVLIGAGLLAGAAASRARANAGPGTPSPLQ